MDRDRRRPDDLLPLRPVEFHILISLARGARHGYGIIQDAERRGEARIPDVGTLYRALRRMRERGLIDESDAPEGGARDERRNYYRITPFGLKVARAEARRLDSLIRAARGSGLMEGWA